MDVFCGWRIASVKRAHPQTRYGGGRRRRTMLATKSEKAWLKGSHRETGKERKKRGGNWPRKNRRSISAKREVVCAKVFRKLCR